MSPASSNVRIPSRGWRGIWVSRIALLVAFGFVATYILSLFGWPWQTQGALFAWLIEAVILVGFAVLVESGSLRWVALSDSGVEFHYLTGTTRLAWTDIRFARGPPPWGLGLVGIEETRPRRFGLVRTHMVTREQADAISHQLRDE
jgi:hypothetical protein